MLLILIGVGLTEANKEKFLKSLRSLLQSFEYDHYDANATWGGNPTIAPSCDSAAYRSHGIDDYYNYQNYGYASGENVGSANYNYPGSQGANFAGPFIGAEAGQEGAEVWPTFINASKQFMNTLSINKHPPCRVMFKVPQIPEASATTTWEFFCDYSVQFSYKRNVLGWAPLSFSHGPFKGWCGTNMFHMRTCANAMQNGGVLNGAIPNQASLWNQNRKFENAYDVPWQPSAATYQIRSNIPEEYLDLTFPGISRDDVSCLPLSQIDICDGPPTKRVRFADQKTDYKGYSCEEDFDEDNDNITQDDNVEIFY